MDKKISLNQEQLKAVRHNNGPLLIIAGAGSGKTTVITERIKYLILEKNIHPSNILALTFTEKAAKEMEERIDIVMPYGYTQMWISTFHAFCDRVLRNEAIHIGLTTDYKLMTQAQSMLFLRKNLFKFSFKYFRPLGNPYKFLEGLLQHFSRLSDEDVSPNEYIHLAQTQNSKVKSQKSNEMNSEYQELRKTLELANAYKLYQELKAKEGVMDFSDLISNALKLFRERKNILKNYQDQFKYALIDEYQDTNYAQNEMANLLSEKTRNITVVGDDDQSIYRFRGSSISNIIQFREKFKDAKIITLTKNYRSTQSILDASYKLIQNNNPDRLEVKEKVDKKLIAEKKNLKSEIDLLFADRVENEAELVSEKIQDFVLKDNYKYLDFAILVRANDHADPFIRQFQRKNIPYQFLGPGKLFHQEEIKDLISYLKVLYSFEDSNALYRVLTMEIFKIESLEISSLLNYSKRKNLTLFEALESIALNKESPGIPFVKDETKEKFLFIFEMVKKHLSKVPKESAGQILYYFMQDSGYLQTAKLDEDVKKYQNIAKFFDKLKTFEAEKEDASVFTVVDWIDLSMQMGESPLASDIDWSKNNAVNILTIHSSKGLEFPVVFLINLVTGRFPVRERREQIPIPQELIKEILPVGDFHLEEERRLFYVGLTRAKDHLFLTAANSYGEGKRERKISPFVYEMLTEEIVNKSINKQLNDKTASNAAMQLSLLEWATPPQPSTLSSQLLTRAPITYLSYSQIQSFEICPLHYKLRYLLKLPGQINSAQSFGTSVHAALRDFYQEAIKGEKIKNEDIETILNKVWINDGYISKQHEKNAFEKAKNLILDYLNKNYDQKKLNILALETPFHFILKDQNLNRLPLKIGGRIDRIDLLENGKIEILDYKTGNIPNEKDLTKNHQLTFYALAATLVNDKILNKKPEEVLLSLYYLEEGKKLTTTRTKEQLEEAQKWIFEKVNEIEKSSFSCKVSSFCQNCEYKILCHS